MLHSYVRITTTPHSITFKHCHQITRKLLCMCEILNVCSIWIWHNRHDFTSILWNFRWAIPPCCIGSQIYVKLQLNRTCNVYILLRSFYIACLNNMFRPFHRPSSGCSIISYKVTIQYSILCFCCQRDLVYSYKIAI